MSHDDQVAAAAAIFTHPLRVQLLKGTIGREASPSMLADELDAPLGNVAYHVRQLAKAGLVVQVGTRPRRGAVEHFYTANGGASESLAALRAATGELLAATAGSRP